MDANKREFFLSKIWKIFIRVHWSSFAVGSFLNTDAAGFQYFSFQYFSFYSLHGNSAF